MSPLPATFELERFELAPITAGVVLLEIEGRLAGGPARASTPRLLVERPGGERREHAPVDASTKDGRVRVSFAVGADDAAGSELALVVGGLLLDLPTPDRVGGADRTVALSRQLNGMRHELANLRAAAAADREAAARQAVERHRLDQEAAEREEVVKRVAAEVSADAERTASAREAEAEQLAAAQIAHAEQAAAERIAQAEHAAAEEIAQVEQEAAEQIAQAEQGAAERVAWAEHVAAERLAQAEQVAAQRLVLAERAGSERLAEAQHAADQGVAEAERPAAALQPEPSPQAEPTIESDERDAEPAFTPAPETRPEAGLGTQPEHAVSTPTEPTAPLGEPEEQAVPIRDPEQWSAPLEAAPRMRISGPATAAGAQAYGAGAPADPVTTVAAPVAPPEGDAVRVVRSTRAPDDTGPVALRRAPGRRVPALPRDPDEVEARPSAPRGPSPHNILLATAAVVVLILFITFLILLF